MSDWQLQLFKKNLLRSLLILTTKRQKAFNLKKNFNILLLKDNVCKSRFKKLERKQLKKWQGRLFSCWFLLGRCNFFPLLLPFLLPGTLVEIHRCYIKMSYNILTHFEIFWKNVCLKIKSSKKNYKKAKIDDKKRMRENSTIAKTR